VCTQSIALSLPELEDDLPPEVRAELAACSGKLKPISYWPGVDTQFSPQLVCLRLDAIPISPALRTLLAQRDKRRCAYCLRTEENCGLRMHVDHIIPETAGGPTIEENLCLACFSCNTAKAAQQTAVDPHTGATVSLFHPLRQRWSEHSSWDESQTLIIGITPCG
jgi:hypothetical protein